MNRGLPCFPLPCGLIIQYTVGSGENKTCTNNSFAPFSYLHSNHGFTDNVLSNSNVCATVCRLKRGWNYTDMGDTRLSILNCLGVPSEEEDLI